MSTFRQECIELRARGWSASEIADHLERSIADVRKALKMPEPQKVCDGGLLPYLGIEP